MLNASKNEANNTSMPTLYIVGAEEYYEKTKDMGAAAADLHYQDMLDAGVGIEAPDDYTLVFTCKDPCPYFDTVASYTSFYPASQALIDELGIETFRGCDNTNMWYCGPYIVEEYIQGNTKSYIPNPHYYNAANVSRFERMTVTMISDQAIAFQLYQNRELDEMDLNESTITTITSDPNNEYNSQLCEKRARPTAYAMHFNYQKNNADGTPDVNWNKAIANTAFRQCFYRGLNLKAWFSRYNKINPLKCENDYYTMKGLCYNTQGVEYTTLGGQGDGLRLREVRRRDHDPPACQRRRHLRPEEAGHGGAERHRRHLPRQGYLLHHRQQHLCTGQRHHPQAVLLRQLRR